jgi:hypothetical protein
VGPAAVDANGVNVNGFGTGVQPNPTSNGLNGNAANSINGTVNPGAAGAATNGTAAVPLSSDIGTGVIYPGGPDLGTTGSGTNGTATTGSGYGGSSAGGSTGASVNGGVGGTNAAARGSITAGGIASPELNAATRREARKERAVVQRRGQMLESITPRTNVDRSNEMPDDPVSPALATPDRPAVRY